MSPDLGNTQHVLGVFFTGALANMAAMEFLPAAGFDAAAVFFPPTAGAVFVSAVLSPPLSAGSNPANAFCGFEAGLEVAGLAAGLAAGLD